MKTLTLGLLLCCATPGLAEETITPEGDRWYLVSNEDPVVVIPPEGVTPPIVICLDEVPGGLDSTPAFQIIPVEKHRGHKRTMTATREAFVPIGTPEVMAYASVVLRGEPGVAYEVYVRIRGKQ